MTGLNTVLTQSVWLIIKVILYSLLTDWNLADFCRTPGYKMGRCISIYECDYLLNILASNSLTQQSIAFLKLSQCDAGQDTTNNPHVCCARNDDSLMLGPHDGLHDKSASAPSALHTASSSENNDDSIIYKSSNSLLPKTNECGREKIENRIYSGQVSWLLLSLLVVLVSVTNCSFKRNAATVCQALVRKWNFSTSPFQNAEREEFPWLALLEYRKGKK